MQLKKKTSPIWWVQKKNFTAFGGEKKKTLPDPNFHDPLWKSNGAPQVKILNSQICWRATLHSI